MKKITDLLQAAREMERARGDVLATVSAQYPRHVRLTYTVVECCMTLLLINVVVVLGLVTWVGPHIDTWVLLLLASILVILVYIAADIRREAELEDVRRQVQELERRLQLNLREEGHDAD